MEVALRIVRHREDQHEGRPGARWAAPNGGTRTSGRSQGLYPQQLSLAQGGRVTAAAMLGSWAGARRTRAWRGRRRGQGHAGPRCDLRRGRICRSKSNEADGDEGRAEGADRGRLRRRGSWISRLKVRLPSRVAARRGQGFALTSTSRNTPCSGSDGRLCHNAQSVSGLGNVGQG